MNTSVFVHPERRITSNEPAFMIAAPA